MIRLVSALCTLSALAFPAQAQIAAAPSGIVTLTPEEREAALEAGASRATDESLQYGASDRRVHGEVGVEIGSRGERGIYGTVVAPVGQNGMAAISYGTGQGPRWRGHNRFRSSSVSGEISSGTSPSPASPAAEAENVNPD